MSEFALQWLPEHPDFDRAIEVVRNEDPEWGHSLVALRELSKYRLNFLQTNKLDRHLQKILKKGRNKDVVSSGLLPLKIAILASSTVDHLIPGLRVAGLRRGLLLQCHVGNYGHYRQDIFDKQSDLYKARPDVVLFSINGFDALPHIPVSTSKDAVEELIEEQIKDWRTLWHQITNGLNASVLIQTIVDPAPTLFGSLDGLVPACRTNLYLELNRRIRSTAEKDGHIVVDMDRWVANSGIDNWFDPVKWFHAKQEIAPQQSPIYGDFVARVIAASQGKSRKCLVLDLDNTLWGGVVGDDGIDGICLGQGSALGEAFSFFQEYVKRLSERGVILAVCSKNDEITAKEVFEKHPEMVLSLDDVSRFIANWENKASNLKQIAKDLNLNTDALVFFDDNEAERALVREILPDVAVPEVPEDPAFFANCLANSGYFEAVSLTAEDIDRTRQYRSLHESKKLIASSTDLESFLRGLSMNLKAGRIKPVDIQRVEQLVKKTNQFNLRTQRYSKSEISQIAEDGSAIALWFRLADRFGDNGLISVIIGRPLDEDRKDCLFIDTWLMSCRVIGRSVENAALSILTDIAKSEGYRTLVGEYLPTKKNGIVREHYLKLGFTSLGSGQAEGAGRWELQLLNYSSPDLSLWNDIQVTAQVLNETDS